MKMLKILITLFIIQILMLSSVSAEIFNFAKFSIGDSRIQVDLNDFFIRNSRPEIEAILVPGSVQWIRNDSNLLVPRALLRISIKSNNPRIHINYNNLAIIPFKKIDQAYESEFYVDLFNPGIISIISGNNPFDRIFIEARDAKTARSKQLIDYSCSRYNLKIDGVDAEYLSIGCKMNRIGKHHDGKPLLEITMSSTNLRMLNGDQPPYKIYLKDNSPVEITMQGIDNKLKIFRLEATLPVKLRRLKTAIGYGPYVYQSEFLESNRLAGLAPSVMLYAKYDLTETASLKAFDALLYSKSLFNNFGLYFSYDLAEALDGRVLLNTLLGFQGLHYKYSAAHETEFHFIYPQGFEVIYKHAFIENYNLVYGVFLSTGAEPYTNTWIRYGKSSFLELNYIEWGNNKSRIEMWGLSVGLPFFSAF